jgi:conjugal transfer mating pair stabilization protein TraG
MSEVNDDLGLLAGYLVASIPFLAGGIARGAMAISSQATSYLNPSQNAAEEAAREASTGNIAVGNSSFDNQTIQTRQHDQWNQAPSFAMGAGQVRAYGETGTVTTSFPSNEVLDVPVSKVPFTPQITKSVSAEAAKVASETRTRADTIANQAVESLSNAVTRFQEFRHAFNTDQSVANSYGNEDRAAITSSFNEVNQASKMLQSRFGLRAEVADTIATEKFLSGSAGLNVGVGGKLGASSGGLTGGGSGGISKRWTKNDMATMSRDGNRIADALNQWSSTRGWAHNQDTFTRSVATTSDYSVASRASGLSSSVTNAQAFSREARHFYEEATRLERSWSVRDGDGVITALNTSDAFLAFARAEIAATPLVYRSFDPANARHWSTNDPQLAAERDLLTSRYVSTAGAKMREEMEQRLVQPSSAGIVEPTDGKSIAFQPTAPASNGVSNTDNATLATAPISTRAAQIRRDVAIKQTRGVSTIAENLRGLDRDTNAADTPTREGAGRARDWGRSRAPRAK